jgi:hypothetical protein
MGEHEDLPYPFRDEAEGSGSERSEGEPEQREQREQDKRRLFERVMPEILKRVVERAVETGASRLAEGPENLRNLLQDMKLPKEVLHYLYQQIDDTKNGLYRVVAKEIRDVLEQTQFADEITKVLTKLSFEIKTEIRFIPNEAGVRRSENADDEPGDTSTGRKLPKPEVTAQVSVKDRNKTKTPFNRSPSTPPSRGQEGGPPPTPGRRREDT